MIKKLFTLLVCLMLAAFPAGASGLFGVADDKGGAADVTDVTEAPSALDAAFASGRLTLVPVAQEADVAVVSFAPSGNAALLMDDDGLLTEYNGKRYRLVMAEHRGAADEHGNLAKWFRTYPQQLLGSEGVTWSPDGRYAVMTNVDAVLKMMKMMHDPIVIDMASGEAFLAATYGNKPLRDGAAMTAATFSRDGRYLYYMLYTTAEEYRTALYRFELATGVVEWCCSGYDTTYYPSLAMLEDGGVMVLLEAMRSGDPQGLVTMHADGTATEVHFDVNRDLWLPQRLLYSTASGWAVMAGRSTQTPSSAKYALQCVRPDDGMAGLNEYVVFDAQSGQAQTVTAAELRQAVETYNAIEWPWANVFSAQLSPNGRYALVILPSERRPREAKMILMRLSDKAVVEVAGYEFGHAKALEILYPPVIEWNGDTLILSTEDGPRTFRIE